MSGSVSFVPDVGSSQVFSTVTNVIAQTLVRADAVYAAAKTNLEEIKDLLNKTWVVTDVNLAGSVASAIGINNDKYHQTDDIANSAINEIVSFSLDSTIDPPDKLILSEIKNNIEFDENITVPPNTVVEPTQAISYFKATADGLAKLRPASTQTLTTITDNLKFNTALTSPGSSAVEPTPAFSYFKPAADGLAALRPLSEYPLTPITDNIEFNKNLDSAGRDIAEPDVVVSNFTDISNELRANRPSPAYPLSPIVDNLEFNKDIDNVDRNVSEPDIAISNFADVSNELRLNRPSSDYMLSPITDNLEFNKGIESAGRNISEPEIAISEFKKAVERLEILRPGTFVIPEISTNVIVDSATKPDVSFVAPPIPTLPDISDIPFPDAVFSFDESFYSSILGTSLHDMILLELQNGSTGLTASVENDIYSRESERDALELQNTKDKIASIWAESGMSLPDGVLVSALASAELDFQNKYSDKSRDVRIESFKRADDNAKFIKDLALKYEQILMDYYNKYWDRKLDSSKSLLLYMQTLYDAIYKYYTIFNERYRAEVEGYKAIIEGQASELDAKTKVYDSEVKYVLGKADVETREVLSEIEFQKTKITNRQLDLALFESDIRNVGLYTENLKAESSNYSAIFSGRAAALDTQIKSFISEIQYESEKVGYEHKKTYIGIDTQKNEMADRQNIIALYSEDIKQVGLYIENLKAEAANYGTIYSNRIADIEAKIKAFMADIQYETEKVNFEHKKTYIDIDTQKNEIADRQNVLNLYESDIHQTLSYVEGLKAETANYGTIYSNRISELDTKIKSFATDIQYETEKVNFEHKKTYVDIDTQKNEIANRQNVLALYDADIRHALFYIEGLKAEASNYGTIYSNRIAALESKIKSFLADIQYETEKVNFEHKKTYIDIDTQKNELADRQNVLALYESDIRHALFYLEGLKAETANYGTIYSNHIAELDVKIKAFMADLQYEIEKVNAEAKRISVETEMHKDDIAEKQIEIEVFNNDLKYEIAKVEVKEKELNSKYEKAKVAAIVHDANVKFSDVDSRYHIGKLQALLESTKQEIDMMKISVEAAISATSNIAQVSSTMVAGALSSLNANASMGTSESQGTSVQSSSSKSESQQQQSSISYNHNYSHSS